MVHLRDRHLATEPGASAVFGYGHTSVERNRHTVGVQRIDPEIVVVPTGSIRLPQLIGRNDRSPTISAAAEAARAEVDLVTVIWCHSATRVIGLTGCEVVVVVD